MSEDQRPVRMRVVNNGMAPTAAVASPQRRRNDPAMLAAAARARAQSRGIGLAGAALFLISCAAGGALLTASHVLEGLGL